MNPCKANSVYLTAVLELVGHAEKLISLRETATTSRISESQGYTYPMPLKNNM